MKNINLSQLNMTPLSGDEMTEIDGGKFWSSFKELQAYILLGAEVLFLEPLREFGHGMQRGLGSGIKG